MKDKFKKFIKKIIPDSILLLRIKLINKKWGVKNKNLKDLFSSVYLNSLWNTENQSNDTFYSGIGSRDKDIITQYQNKIKDFFKTLKYELKVLDLGCGDFYVHSDLVDLTNDYIAVDIVPDLIEYNKKKYSNLKVSFLNLDITKDNLPDANLVLIREVLQHLSNKNINKILENIKKNNYNHIILTEVLPLDNNFIANKEFLDGPHTRMSFLESGIDITKNPFNFNYKNKIKLLEIKIKNYRLVTTAFEI